MSGIDDDATGPTRYQNGPVMTAGCSGNEDARRAGQLGASTRAVHADRPAAGRGSVSPPIFQTSTFSSSSDEAFRELCREPRPLGMYTRYGNPNHGDVAAVIAALEGADSALVLASGMSALTTIALTFLEPGAKVVVQRHTYGGTADLVTGLLTRFGIEAVEVDQTDLMALEGAIDDRTRLVFLESPSNPLLDITDIAAASAAARRVGAITVVDNTFATPINQRPIELGADLMWHSATKYLGGHSDLSAGVIAGSQELISAAWRTSVQTGPVLGPFDAWLLLRGIRTLPLRILRHNDNAQALAEVLLRHERVTRVNYPGLASSSPARTRPCPDGRLRRHAQRRVRHTGRCDHLHRQPRARVHG
jgi:methionine-gamma-lyase